MIKTIVKYKMLLVFTIIILGIIAARIPSLFFRERPVNENTPLNILLADIRAHASPELRLGEGHDLKSFWITPDGHMVAVVNQFALTSYYQGVIFDDPETKAKLDELTRYAKKTLIDAGYFVDPINMSTSTESPPFYTVRTAFSSKDGNHRCSIEPNDSGSPVWFMECISRADLELAYTSQLPFIHALGDVKELAAIPVQNGNFARVSVTNGSYGDYAIMRNVNGKWATIYRGQDTPACALMKQNAVPVSIYKTCH